MADALTLRDVETAPRHPRDIPRATLIRWLNAGLIERAHGHVRITPAGRVHLAATAFPRSE